MDFRGCSVDESVAGSAQVSGKGCLTFFEYERIVSIVKPDDSSIVSGKQAIETLSVSMISGGRGTAFTKSSTGI
jgi:hypothetical protein